MSEKSATVVPFSGVEAWEQTTAQPADRWHPVATIAFVIVFNGLAWTGIAAAIAAIV